MSMLQTAASHSFPKDVHQLKAPLRGSRMRCQWGCPAVIASTCKECIRRQLRDGWHCTWCFQAAGQLCGHRLSFQQKKDCRESKILVRKIIKTLAKQVVLWVREVHLKHCQTLQVLMFLMFMLTNFFWHVNFFLSKKLPRQKKQNYYIHPEVTSINKDRSATSLKFICIRHVESISFSEENVQYKF